MAESSHAHYNWNEYIDLCERLVARVGMSGWQFDCVLCLARGGMRPGDFFSRIYNKPLAVLSTSSYREAAGTVQGELLLVDDLCDSGMTIRKVVEHLKRNYPKITEIRVAVIWTKACSVFKPDYCVVHFNDSPWIHQPFECYDDLGIENHIANCRKKFGDAI